MIYAMIMKNGVTQSVTRDEFRDLVETLSRKDLVGLVFKFSDEIGRLRVAAGELPPDEIFG